MPDEQEKQREEENRILLNVTQTSALATVAEIAKGVKYDEPIKTRLVLLMLLLFGINTKQVTKFMFSWRPPKHIRCQTDEDANQFRRKKGISVDGESCPAAIGSFLVSPIFLLLI